MKKIALLAALAALIATPSHAATLAINLGNTSTAITYGVAGALNPNINLATYGGLALTTNAIVVNPATSLSMYYSQPTGSIYQNNYLAVLDNPPGPGTVTPGSATFTLAAGQHSFAFTWGTIDDFNTLTITDSRNVTYTITGTDILTQIGGTDHTAQADVNFIDTFGTIVSATFSTTSNSFEAANFGQSNVPLPASLPLFGAALMGLLFFARRERVKA
ncbi:MAG TPA: VPLPA-CTERM sorting domain-containing protein [Alphaproteobacteria bacterium]|nr:VPLPA-CTERM sorting domain-containing protein [Alphaproteobacteria bacterium]